jgi:hypothetical protein
MENDQSVLLSEALQHFSDPSDWEELCSLEPYAITLLILGAPETESERRHWRFHQLKGRLEAELVAKLAAGSLQATGLEPPVGLDDEPRFIQAEWWDKLEVDFAASEARRAGGPHVVDIRVRATQLPLSQRNPADTYVFAEHVSLARLRANVRRWLEQEARAHGTSWQKKHYCSAARTRFGERVTDNLFNEVWRSAHLPEALRRPGLRKSNQYSTGSSRHL